MSSDEPPPKHLGRPRGRGAPTATAAAAATTGGYDVEETWRQTARALVVPLERALTLPALRAAFARLTAVAARQKLTIAEGPLFGLRGDPENDPPARWGYEAVLPIRGAARREGDVTVMRIDGGMHLAATTPRGLDDLKRLYGYLLGTRFPAKHQQLARPYILHRLADGQARAPDEAIAVAVYAPAVLSIAPVPVPTDEPEA
ncbi:hypothetical protein BE04_44945 [Sorangium cellulosum]|uniref:Bacterial transcription activator effector binding domain-containing protein n=2 Tax=Sorangium cellulosum TaxID=56 RepID=A0A150NZG3_SORCE|nr:GyrI-like domain-containing protein [Sorangium cellulosum]AGP40633.1 hypothetical protein SCE1572_42740 [Sorangium cellulosum So0157-2]KYF47615.1 hypothetical protein BE04_44945 [Sorangium cellulosum]